jgi:predicted nucleic acid-binding protein
MRALIDTNIILDVLLNREEFLPESGDVWIANEQGVCDGFISAITPINVYYIAKRWTKDKKIARQMVLSLLDKFQVCTVSLDELRSAVYSEVEDYEDAVQVISALKSQVDVIVTRNVSDFANSPIRALSPADFVRELD